MKRWMMMCLIHPRRHYLRMLKKNHRNRVLFFSSCCFSRICSIFSELILDATRMNFVVVFSQFLQRSKPVTYTKLHRVQKLSNDLEQKFPFVDLGTAQL